MNRLAPETVDEFVASLVQGGTVRGSAENAGVTLNTGLRNLVWVGNACQKYHDEHVRNLKCAHIQCDELWSFVYAKTDNLPEELKEDKTVGDVWTWTSIDPITKLIVNTHIGKHEPSDAKTFITDLASRIPGKVQISTDQLMTYRPAIEEAFGNRVDYATVRKVLDNTPKSPDGKFEQPPLKAMRQASVFGNPDLTKVRTANVERNNLSIRHFVRRFARSTIAFSRKIENKRAALALHVFYHNFCRYHPKISGSPAMEAGLTDHLWSIRDLTNLVSI